MSPVPLKIRARHAWAVWCGKIILPAQLAEMELMADLTKTAAALADLSTAADRLIALNQQNAADLATANSTIAAADDSISTQVAAVTAKITAEAPAPVVDPTAPTGA